MLFNKLDLGPFNTHFTSVKFKGGNDVGLTTVDFNVTWSRLRAKKGKEHQQINNKTFNQEENTTKNDLLIQPYFYSFTFLLFTFPLTTSYHAAQTSSRLFLFSCWTSVTSCLSRSADAGMDDKRASDASSWLSPSSLSLVFSGVENEWDSTETTVGLDKHNKNQMFYSALINLVPELCATEDRLAEVS